MAKPKPIIIIDTAEQRPFKFTSEVMSVRGSLWSGDCAIVAPNVPEYVTRRRVPTKGEVKPAFPVLYAPHVASEEQVAICERKREDGSKETVRVLVLPFRVERKSADDLAGCCIDGPETRDRFEAELARLATFGPGRAVVVVEAGLAEIARHTYRSKLAPAALVASTIAWQQRTGVGFIWAGNRALAARWTERFLLRALEDHLAEEAARPAEELPG